MKDMYNNKVIINFIFINLNIVSEGVLNESKISIGF